MNLSYHNMQLFTNYNQNHKNIFNILHPKYKTPIILLTLFFMIGFLPIVFDLDISASAKKEAAEYQHLDTDAGIISTCGYN